MPEWLLVTCELVFLAAFVAGVALVYVPAAFIVGGALGVLACERLGRTRKARP